MFKKVLVAEDLDTISVSLQNLLNDLGVEEIDQVQYCDDAYLKILKSSKEAEHYDLLISDLSFKADHRPQNLTNGEDLVKMIRNEFPDLKIIIYSIEDRMERIRYLVNDLKINGYVCKGRRGLRELQEAIKNIYDDKIFISSELRFQFHNPSAVEILDSDILLLKLMSEGFSQEEISKKLKKKGITPSSLSSIEKRLNILKNNFSATNSINLISICKDLGLI